MKTKSILKEGKRYTYSDYYALNNPTEEIVAEFGYNLYLKHLELPLNADFDKTVLDKLRNSYYELLPKVTINSEAAKREFMIAPLLYEVLRQVDAKLNIEYPLDIDDKLSGFIDYLIRSC